MSKYEKNKIQIIKWRLSLFFYSFREKRLFYWNICRPIIDTVNNIYGVTKSEIKIFYGQLKSHFTNTINILNEEDYLEYISTLKYEIVRPKDRKLDVTANFDNPNGKYNYPILSEDNIHLRKDKKFYLNFTNKRYTGAILSFAEGTRHSYFLDGGLVLTTHYRHFKRGTILVERCVTRNGNFFREYPLNGTGIKADSKRGIKEVSFIPNLEPLNLPWSWSTSKTDSFVSYNRYGKRIEHIMSPNEWYALNPTKRKYYKNGVLKQCEINFLSDNKTVIFYYPDGPKKEAHTYTTESLFPPRSFYLWTKEHFGRAYRIDQSYGEDHSELLYCYQEFDKFGGLIKNRFYLNSLTPDELRNDKKFILDAILTSGAAADWDEFNVKGLNDSMLADKEIMLTLIKCDFPSFMDAYKDGHILSRITEDMEIINAIKQMKKIWDKKIWDYSDYLEESEEVKKTFIKEMKKKT